VCDVSVEAEEYLDLALEDGIETTLMTIVKYLGSVLKCMFVSKTEGRWWRERRNTGAGIPKRANWTIVLEERGFRCLIVSL
jgi:hypothetical protein